MVSDADCLSGASERIEKHRKGNLTISVAGPDGRPLPGRTVAIEQTGSAFLFGCNFFRLDPEDQSRQQRDYQRLFCGLLNYATLPFYWGQYEREPGITREARLKATARWCAEHSVRTKGHPLVWHEVYPAWADAPNMPALKLLEARVKHIVTEFSGLIGIWDVINESTVSDRFENAIGRWAREKGAVGIAAESLRWARSAAPAATLVLNDYNVSPAYEAQIEELLAGEGRPDVIGIQTHMHDRKRPFEDIWRICETYARFGLPLHFTELTVLSGHYIPPNVAWSGYREDDWPSTPEGEEKQCRYLEQFYTLLFSHPAVAAITCWDFADGGWMNAPAGLVRRDMTPKPIYERLLQLVRKDWRTNVTLTTDAGGKAAVSAFHGSYVVTDTASGVQKRLDHAPGKRTRATLKVR